MSYVEVLRALWFFIKELMDSKNKGKKKEITLKFVLSVLLVASLIFNMFLFIRVFDITRHYMEIHAVDSRTIKMLTETRQLPPIKIPNATNTNLTDPKKPVNKVKDDKVKHVEKRVNNLKNRFDKIKSKED